VWEHPGIEEKGETFACALEAFLARRSEIDVVIPLGDRELTALGHQEPALPTGVRLVMASPRTVRLCLDKPRMCQLAVQLQVPQAEFRDVSSLRELEREADRIGYPCIVKPTDQLARIFGEKAAVLRSPERLREVFVDWPTENASLFVQRWVSGARHNIHFFAHEGKLVRSVETRVLRTTRPDHTGYTVEAVSIAPSPELQQPTRQLVAHLEYSGLGCAQYLVDPEHGSACFLEINPRLGAAFAAAAAAGVDFPRLAVEWGHGSGTAAAGAAYLPGKRIAWLLGDLQGLGRAIARRQVSTREGLRWLLRALWSGVRADIHATWSWRDPLPTAVASARFALRGPRALLRRLAMPRE
jgi:predicted ATP-grasp superfamily ATP-dependent carboligase